jgi:hypothetical protein
VSATQPLMKPGRNRSSEGTASSRITYLVSYPPARTLPISPRLSGIASWEQLVTTLLFSAEPDPD